MADSKVKGGRGCLFYGILIVLVMFLFVLAGALIALHAAKRMLNEFTETKPMPLPVVELPPSDMAKLKDRIGAFQNAARDSLPAPPLSLTADELNALLATEPHLESFRGRLHVTIDGDHLGGLVSLPLEQAGLPMFKGRFLNGTATFILTLQNGTLWLSVGNFVVKGKPLPAGYLDKIRAQNLAAGVNNDQRALHALGFLQSIRVTDGKVVLEAKPE
jgi:hypothetical protein